MLCFRHHRSKAPPHELGDPELLRRRRAWQFRDAPVYVTQRAERALFFACQERHADGAQRLHIHGAENPQRFQHDHDAGAIVGGSGSGGPTVKMSSSHDHVILANGIDAGKIGEDADAFYAVSRDLGIQVQLDAHGNVSVEQPLHCGRGSVEAQTIPNGTGIACSGDDLRPQTALLST